MRTIRYRQISCRQRLARVMAGWICSCETWNYTLATFALHSIKSRAQHNRFKSWWSRQSVLLGEGFKGMTTSHGFSRFSRSDIISENMSFSGRSELQNHQNAVCSGVSKISTPTASQHHFELHGRNFNYPTILDIALK